MSIKLILQAQFDECIEELDKHMKEKEKDNDIEPIYHWYSILKNMRQQRKDLFSDPTKLPDEVQLTEKELKFAHRLIKECIREMEISSKWSFLSKEELDRSHKLKTFYETLDFTELEQLMMFHGLKEYNEHQQCFGAIEEYTDKYYSKSVYTNEVMSSIESSLVLMSVKFL